MLDYQRQGRTPTALRAVPAIERAARVHLLVAIVMVAAAIVMLDGGAMLLQCLLFFGITSLLFSVAVVILAVRPVRRVGWIALWSALFGVASISFFAIVDPPHVRDVANRIKCAANMRVIGQVMFAYAQAYGGRLPDSLDQLADGWSDMGMFVCPSTEDTPAPGTSPSQQAVELTSGGHLSYIYCGKGLQLSSSSDIVILWEPFHNHPRRGANALRLDGRVDLLEPAEVADLQTGINPPRSLHSKSATQPAR